MGKTVEDVRAISTARHDSGQFPTTESFGIVFYVEKQNCPPSPAQRSYLNWHAWQDDPLISGVPSRIVRWTFDWSEYPAGRFSDLVRTFLRGSGWEVEFVENGDGKSRMRLSSEVITGEIAVSPEHFVDVMQDLQVKIGKQRVCDVRFRHIGRFTVSFEPISLGTRPFCSFAFD